MVSDWLPFLTLILFGFISNIDQEIDGWKILEINPKSIKVKKGNQSETIRILN